MLCAIVLFHQYSQYQGITVNYIIVICFAMLAQVKYRQIIKISAILL